MKKEEEEKSEKEYYIIEVGRTPFWRGSTLLIRRRE